MQQEATKLSATYKVYKQLEALPKDETGWIEYNREAKQKVADALGITLQEIPMTVNTLLTQGYIDIIKEGHNIIGVKLMREPFPTALDAARAAARARRNVVTQTNQPKQKQHNGAATTNGTEEFPENLSYLRKLVTTPELERYANAKKFANEAIESPYLQVVFHEDPMAEEALRLRDALLRAEDLLVERTRLLNSASRSANYLRKAQNPILRSALQDAGVLVKHGD